MRKLALIAVILALIVIAVPVSAAGPERVVVDATTWNQTDTNQLFFIAGDANGDHKVNIGDIVCIERTILGLMLPGPGCDANRDSDINMGDVVKVERYILLLDFTLGDANHSGQVDRDDIETVVKMILRKIPANLEADVNGDCKINAADITALERMLD